MTRRLKRFLDLLGSFLGVIVLSPVLLGIAVAIRLSMGSPVMFSQSRSGLHGRPFRLWKFRSMTGDCDEAGCLLSDEQRLTSLGSLLRKTALDELPQLWNVLKGEMSFIGPRPLPVEYWDLYTAEQRRRHEVPPGIVGWAGVNGRNANTWEKKFELDLWYVDNWSLLLDAKIFFLAIGTVLSGSGVNQEGHATCGRFMGTPDPGIERPSGADEKSLRSRESRSGISH
jgi:sugar transferase EpsL